VRERRLALIFGAVALLATGLSTACPRPGTDDRAIEHVRLTHPAFGLPPTEERDSPREADTGSQWLLVQGIAGAWLFWVAGAHLRKRTD